MTFNPAHEFDITAQHYARLAMTPGWWQYARQAVAAIEAHPDTCALFAGLRAAVAALVASARYRPAPAELVELWIEKDKGVDEWL